MEIKKLDQLLGQVGMEGDGDQLLGQVDMEGNGDQKAGSATRTGRHGGRWRLRSWTSY